MAIKGEWIRYAGGAGYLAAPEGAESAVPAVLVIQEVWGVNANIEGIARRIAAEGYAALAPDLFAVDGARPEELAAARIEEAIAFSATLPPGTMFSPARDAALASLEPGARGRITATFDRMFSFVAPGKMEGLMPPLKAAFRHLRTERPATPGRGVACVGFCMGGGLSALLSCEEPELAGAAVFYGMSPPAEKVAAGRCPIMGFYGARDERVNAGIPAFDAAMAAAGRSFESQVYPGAGHAFFNDSSPAYSAEAARDSWERLKAFFSRVLAKP